MAPWSFRLLGELEVTDGTRTAPIGGGKLRVVLATLLLRANQTVSVADLVDRLWDDQVPSGARATVQAYVMRLRKALDDRTDLIRTRPGGYLISVDDDQLDLSRFRALVERADGEDPATAAATLREALALWRGPALADVPSESLHRLHTPHLEEERLRALDRRIDLDLELGRHDGLASELAELITSHPYRERFRCQHMLTLVRTGRQADALASYREIQARLDDDLGVAPGPELQQLHVDILRADAVPAASVPRQLPADASAFTGREACLAALDRVRATVVIHGTPGVGKTALAVRWGHHRADRFPDGQLYVNLRGFDPDHPPLDPGEALGRMLRALGVQPDRIPRSEDERAGLFRSTVADRRLLVLLDNAATVDQVRPLLAGTPSCRTVVTSRNQLAGLVAVDGAESLPLDVLSPTDAVRLLANAVGQDSVADDPAATELAELCAYLPLALRLAAGKLRVRPKHTIAAEVTALRAGSRLAALAVPGDAKAAVRPAFDLSYRALSDDEQTLFRLLGTVPGPDITAEAAAALLDVPVPDAQRLLDSLVIAHLVECHVVGRYRLHDLLRLYAREVCGSSGRDALRRLADWYVDTTEAAAELLHPAKWLLRSPVKTVFTTESDAWDWLEAELANLVAFSLCWDMPSVSWRLADALRGFFLARTQHGDLWQATAQHGLTAAREAGDKRAEAAMLLNLGTVHWGQCDDEGFRDHSVAAANLANEIGWHYCEAIALGNAGHAYANTDRPEDATDYLERALALWRTHGTPTNIANALRILGQMHGHLGNLRTATTHFTEALALTRQSGAVLDQTDSLGGLSWTYWQLGETYEAEGYMVEGLALARQQNSRFREALCYYRLAEAAVAHDRPTEAADLVQRALDLARTGGRTTAEVDVLNGVGRVTRQLGHPEQALAHHQAALDLAASYGYGNANALLGLAKAHAAMGNLAEAEEAATKARQKSKAVGHKLTQGQAAAALAETALAQGDIAKAREHANEALELHRETGHKPGEVEILDLLASLPAD